MLRKGDEARVALALTVIHDGAGEEARRRAAMRRQRRRRRRAAVLPPLHAELMVPVMDPVVVVVVAMGAVRQRDLGGSPAAVTTVSLVHRRRQRPHRGGR